MNRERGHPRLRGVAASHAIMDGPVTREAAAQITVHAED